MSTFHPTYAAARADFRAAATAAGFDQQALPMPHAGPDGGSLTLDVAVKARGTPRRAVVISSGTHGVEGTFGSAVQIALLRDRLQGWTPQEGEAVVLLHAVNAWGMAHGRRVDADGIDLNRNFLRAGKAFAGAPAGYVRLDGLLNPKSPPGGLDPFLARAGVQLARYGLRALKDAIASGQYDFPQGLFFGGHGPSAAQQALAGHLPGLLGSAERVIHIDLHTGMGRWGTHVLAVDFPARSDRVRQLSRELQHVQGLDASGVLYEISGALGPWLQELLPTVRYDTLLAEFGTWNVIRVLSNLRWENRAWHWSDDPAHKAEGARRLRETFCPADEGWRRAVVDDARGVFELAAAAVLLP